MEPIVIEYLDPKKESERPNVVRMRSRILRPAEYIKLRSEAKPFYRSLFDAALLTGNEGGGAEIIPSEAGLV